MYHHSFLEDMQGNSEFRDICNLISAAEGLRMGELLQVCNEQMRVSNGSSFPAYKHSPLPMPSFISRMVSSKHMRWKMDGPKGVSVGLVHPSPPFLFKRRVMEGN